MSGDRLYADDPAQRGYPVLRHPAQVEKGHLARLSRSLAAADDLSNDGLRDLPILGDQPARDPDRMHPTRDFTAPRLQPDGAGRYASDDRRRKVVLRKPSTDARGSPGESRLDEQVRRR